MKILMSRIADNNNARKILTIKDYSLKSNNDDRLLLMASLYLRTY